VNKKQRGAIERYVKQIQPLLGLDGWLIEVSEHEPPNEDTLGRCSTPFGRKMALLQFSDDLLEGTNVFVAETIIHEMLHAVRAQSKHALYRCCPGKRRERDAVLAAYIVSQEYEIDSLSVGLAKVFPEFGW
jgi:hypothetical protein